MLCRITQSSDEHRTESVSVMDHEQTMKLLFILSILHHAACLLHIEMTVRK